MEPLETHAFPYDNRPDYTVWRRSVGALAPAAIDPSAPVRFRLTQRERIASAGSCFARHIAENLRAHGYAYFATEADGDYSARFGNIYSTLQLLQLFESAFGTFRPCESVWRQGERFVDALRPREYPAGFPSPEAVEAARARHLAAVRELFLRLDVLVFTLGLTETWCARADGTAYPVCPGKGLGEFDPARYVFRNLGVAENIELLDAFITRLAAVNPGARVILTVSPVPLAATMEDRHVLQSTIASKSVLRVSADEMRRRHANVEYFWSYDIVSGTFNNERYFEPDRRNVNERGVAHVMESFFRHFGDPAHIASAEPAPARAVFDPCDEERLNALLAKEFS